MEYVGIESVKNSYRDILHSRGDYEGAAAINTMDFKTPLFQGYSVHAEDEPIVDDINNALQRIGIDLVALDAQYASVADMYSELMNEVLMDLDSVDDVIAMEEERIQDMNIIIGNIPEFASIISLKYSDFTGDASAFDENTFTTTASTRNSVVLNIDDISGNGYEGNKYVYSNNGFESDSIDTSNRDFAIDDSSTSYYEYCRITMVNKQQHYPEDVNFDNIEAQCTISLSCEELFNTIRLQSDIDTVEVTQISVSEDGGVTYTDTMDRPLQINNASKKYENDEYIFGSGVLCFPKSKNVKVTLRSNGSLDDTLAFKKLILNDAVVNKYFDFDFKDYIDEYLGPLVANYCISHEKYANLPPSVIIAIALVRTGNRPSAVGMMNFWNLDYNSELTNQPNDNGKCAFWDNESAVYAICMSLKTKQFSEVMAKLPSKIWNTTDAVKKEVLKDILILIDKNGEAMAARAQQLVEKYNLRRFDSITGLELDDKTALKYEQYFRRHDEQEIVYEQMLEDAESLIKLETARRHVIRVNNLMGFSNTYDESASLSTEELLTGNVSCIGIFANEYIPPTFPSNASNYGYEPYIVYVLTINGKDYEVVPINSHKAGTKIIRYSNYSIADNYTYHVGEPIKSAKLTVKINTPDPSYSPYVSNIKVCIGKAVTK
jgi:hypothetical protein